MSGHSKWSKIKRQKASSDQKKGNLFTKLSQAISVAAKKGGEDPEMNLMLKIAIEKAKEANMPKPTIERAVNKGLGKMEEGQQLEQVSYEVVGKDGVAFIVDCITDNKRRTIAQVRNIASKAGYSLGSGVAWQFKQKGRIILEPLKRHAEDQDKKIKGKMRTEEIILDIMEIDGVEDVALKREGIGGKEIVEVITSREHFLKVFKAIEEMGLVVNEAEISKNVANRIRVDKSSRASVLNLKEQLEDSQDVEKVWTNVSL